MCKSVSSSSVHGTDMSLHRRLDEQTVLVTAVIVVVNHGLQIIRIFLHRLENLIFLGTKPLNLLHPFIFLCSIGISLPDEFFLTHVFIGILLIGWERDGRYPRSIEMLEKMADIFHVPLTYLQPDQSLFIERAAEAYGKKGKIEAQHLAFELTELFASGELTPQDMDGIMYEMHKAYFKYREQKREKERIMNL